MNGYAKVVDGNIIDAPLAISKSISKLSEKEKAKLGYYKCSFINYEYDREFENRTLLRRYFNENKTAVILEYEISPVNIFEYKNKIKNKIDKRLNDLLSTNYKNIQLRNAEDRFNLANARIMADSGIENIVFRMSNNETIIFSNKDFIELHNDIINRDYEFRKLSWEAKDRVDLSSSLRDTLYAYEVFVNETIETIPQ